MEVKHALLPFQVDQGVRSLLIAYKRANLHVLTTQIQ